jgi:hypothetical protein
MLTIETAHGGHGWHGGGHHWRGWGWGPASVSQSGLASTGAGDAGQTIMAAGFRAAGSTDTATKSLA